MLYVVFNSDGSIKALKVGESIQQGDHLSKQLFAAIDGIDPSDYTCSCEFELPDGEINELAGVESATSTEVYGEYYPGYVVTFTEAQTRLAGNLKVNLKLIDLQGVILCTYQVVLKVNPTGYNPNDTNITEAQYNSLLQSINSKLPNTTLFIEGGESGTLTDGELALIQKSLYSTKVIAYTNHLTNDGHPHFYVYQFLQETNDSYIFVQVGYVNVYSTQGGVATTRYNPTKLIVSKDTKAWSFSDSATVYLPTKDYVDFNFLNIITASPGETIYSVCVRFVQIHGNANGGEYLYYQNRLYYTTVQNRGSAENPTYIIEMSPVVPNLNNRQKYGCYRNTDVTSSSVLPMTAFIDSSNYFEYVDEPSFNAIAKTSVQGNPGTYSQIKTIYSLLHQGATPTNGINYAVGLVELNNYGLAFFKIERSGASSSYKIQIVDFVTGCQYSTGDTYLSGDTFLFTIMAGVSGSYFVGFTAIATKAELAQKQDKLIAGAGITIASDNTISSSASIHLETVSVLPATGDSDTIYLVPSSADPSIYEQWVYTNSQWVQIGSTTVDLSNYVQKNGVLPVIGVAGTDTLATLYTATSGAESPFILHVTSGTMQGYYLAIISNPVGSNYDYDFIPIGKISILSHYYGSTVAGTTTLTDALDSTHLITVDVTHFLRDDENIAGKEITGGAEEGYVLRSAFDNVESNHKSEWSPNLPYAVLLSGSTLSDVNTKAGNQALIIWYNTVDFYSARVRSIGGGGYIFYFVNLRTGDRYYSGDNGVWSDIALSVAISSTYLIAKGTLLEITKADTSVVFTSDEIALLEKGQAYFKHAFDFNTYYFKVSDNYVYQTTDLLILNAQGRYVGENATVEIDRSTGTWTLKDSSVNSLKAAYYTQNTLVKNAIVEAEPNRNRIQYISYSDSNDSFYSGLYLIKITIDTYGSNKVVSAHAFDLGKCIDYYYTTNTNETGLETLALSSIIVNANIQKKVVSLGTLTSGNISDSNYNLLSRIDDYKVSLTVGSSVYYFNKVKLEAGSKLIYISPISDGNFYVLEIAHASGHAYTVTKKTTILYRHTLTIPGGSGQTYVFEVVNHSSNSLTVSGERTNSNKTWRIALDYGLVDINKLLNIRFVRIDSFGTYLSAPTIQKTSTYLSINLNPNESNTFDSANLTDTVTEIE